MKYMYKYVNNC